MDFYYFSLCHVCKLPKPDLKKCSSCKVLHYCSREHQLKDWPNHKEICKAITKTNKRLRPPKVATPEEFNHFKYSLALLWHAEMKRPLQLFEHHMWMFPKVCSVCYTTEVTLVCQRCVSVAYCCNAHQSSHKEEHLKHCESLRLCLAIHQFTYKEMMVVDWLNCKIQKDVKALPKSLGEIIELMGYKPQQILSRKYVHYIITSEFFAPAVNIIHALERTRFIENRRGKKSRIIIHIVGSDDSEFKMCWPLILEFLSHWITNLKGVKICLIGPSAAVQNTSYQFNCQECQAKNFFGSTLYVEGFYHHHIDTLTRPDLIVVFNSGLHEFKDSEIKDTWKETIPKLISFKGVPLLLTAYTETELKKDIARFDQEHLKFLLEPQRNPYANLRPIRNWEEGGEPVFYLNNYVVMVTRK